MKKYRYGFTLIEVAIFLAVTGALFAAVTIGVQNSIYQQRYNDTVQNFVSFLENLYAEVANVQSIGTGRGSEAVYGKLVTFGEKPVGDVDQNKQVIHVYTVIADAVNSTSDLNSGKTLPLLKSLHANVIKKDTVELAGMEETYTPKWAGRIQNKDDFEDYKGALLIVRNPKSGMIQTFVMDKATIDVEDAIANAGGYFNVFDTGSDTSYLDGNNFKSSAIDFCVNPNGSEESGNRADVRIIAGARDASGVEIVPLDSDKNVCNK